MHKDTIKGAAKDAMGAVKKTVGHVTGNERLEASGMVDQVIGKAEKAVGETKDALRDALKK
jgi:uncharacterized protein YjbJ (UPF0337 family)